MSEPNNIGWYIVKFIDEDTIEAVPSNWLKNFENCVWPYLYIYIYHIYMQKRIKWLLQLNKKKIKR